MNGSKLLGNASLYLISNVINAAIPFLLLPILTRALSPSDYGYIAMFNMVIVIFNAFTGLSVHGAVTVRFFQVDKRALAEYVGACIVILLISTAVIVVFVVIFNAEFMRYTGLSADWLILSVIISGIQFLCNIQLALWQVRGEAKLYGAFQITQSLLNLLISIVLIINLGMKWEGRIWAQVITTGLSGIGVMALLIKGRYIAKPRALRIDMLNALKFGVPLIPHTISATLIAISGRFIITNMLDVASTGIYMVSMQFGVALSLIAEAFGKAYSPWMFSKLKTPSLQTQYLLVGVNYLIFVFFLLMALIAATVVYFIFPYIVGEKFIAARELIFWIMLGNAFTGMYFAVGGFIWFSSKTKYISMATIGSGIISLTVTLTLIKPLGVFAAALGFALSQVFMFLFTWYISARIYPMPWTSIRRSVTLVLSIGIKYGQSFLGGKKGVLRNVGL